jgi:hypothetical protein
MNLPIYRPMPWSPTFHKWSIGTVTRKPWEGTSIERMINIRFCDVDWEARIRHVELIMDRQNSNMWSPPC